MVGKLAEALVGSQQEAVDNLVVVADRMDCCLPDFGTFFINH